jgi:predicted  nucleic acid-binding Zn-ribbon protein
MVEPDNLVLEYLREIRGDTAKMSDRINTLSAEMTTVRQYLAGLVTLVEHDHSDIAVIKTRLDRIEKRLDLVE